MGYDSSYLMKVGPVGNIVGNPWDEKGNSKVVQIFLFHGEWGIKSIQFQYYAEDETLVLSNRYGHQPIEDHNFDAVRLNYPTEYITGITAQEGYLYIWSITVTTNLGVYGPLGPTTDTKEYSIKLGKDRQFGGFHGTADNVGLRSIGLYLKPIMK